MGAICVVRGRALGAMERRSGAGSCFLKALHKDVYCYEALDYITRHHMLTPQEGNFYFYLKKNGLNNF